MNLVSFIFPRHIKFVYFQSLNSLSSFSGRNDTFGRNYYTAVPGQPQLQSNHFTNQKIRFGDTVHQLRALAVSSETRDFFYWIFKIYILCSDQAWFPSLIPPRSSLPSHPSNSMYFLSFLTHRSDDLPHPVTLTLENLTPSLGLHSVHEHMHTH